MVRPLGKKALENRIKHFYTHSKANLLIGVIGGIVVFFAGLSFQFTLEKWDNLLLSCVTFVFVLGVLIGVCIKNFNMQENREINKLK